MRLYLHIGTEKTGTTTLQSALCSSAADIADLGYFFPTTILGNSNNSNLIVIAGAITQPNDYFVAKALSTTQTTLDTLVSDTAKRMEQALLLRPYHTAVFSSEQLHSRLVDLNTKVRLREFLVGFFDTIKIIVYIRRQDTLAVSLLSTLLQNGQTVPKQLLVPTDSPIYLYDYARLIKEYGEVFGYSNIVVRIYELDALAFGDVLVDFERIVGLPFSAVKRVANRNVSLSMPALEFLDEWNDLNPKSIGGEANPDRAIKLRSIIPLLRKVGGHRPSPRPTDVEEFLSTYEPGNKWIGEHFFPGRAHLFSDDYRSYPEDGILFSDESTQGRRAARAAAVFGLI